MKLGKTHQEEELLSQAGEFFRLKKFVKAKSIIKKVISLYHNSPEAYYNLALILAEEKKYKESIFNYKKAIKHLPTFELAHLNLGVIYIKNNQLDYAIKVFENLINYNPYNHDALINLGLALTKKNKLHRATDVFRQAIELDPNYAHSHFQLGTLMMQTGKLESASNFFKRAIVLNTSFAPAHAALGSANMHAGRYDEALENFQTAEKCGIDPDTIAESLYTLARKVCDWELAKVSGQRLDKIATRLIDNSISAYEPLLTNIERVDSPKENLLVAKHTAHHIYQHIKQVSKKFDSYNISKPHERIRIGYLSHDFHNHPVTSQIADLFRLHNRSKFEVFTYSYGTNDHSLIREKIESGSEHFIDLENIDHEQIATRIYKDKVDVLVDLVGFTGFHRQDIMAHKPAPIQMSYLGFPGTSGAEYIDYIIADKIVIPSKEHKFYSEKVLYMPNCYQLCSHQKISQRKYNKKDFGLPEDAFIFCSFNRQSKIDQSTFDCWISILKQTPHGIIWLYADNEIAKNNLRQYFVHSGLSSERLIFANKMPLDKHLARLKLADLALDTMIYSGGATTANMLWSGVPVISVYGKHFLSRMSSSILTNIGLSKLVTKNLNDYEQLAVELAKNPQMLSEMKSTLVKNRKSFPLFNSKLFVKNLEDIYSKIVANYQSNTNHEKHL